jgi:hypothetical protein
MDPPSSFSGAGSHRDDRDGVQPAPAPCIWSRCRLGRGQRPRREAPSASLSVPSLTPTVIAGLVALLLMGVGPSLGPTPVRGAISLAQRGALVDLYTSTGGPGWVLRTSWLAGDPCEASWTGVVCDVSQTVVSYVVPVLEWQSPTNFPHTTQAVVVEGRAWQQSVRPPTLASPLQSSVIMPPPGPLTHTPGARFKLVLAFPLLAQGHPPERQSHDRDPAQHPVCSPGPDVRMAWVHAREQLLLPWRLLVAARPGTVGTGTTHTSDVVTVHHWLSLRLCCPLPLTSHIHTP